MEDSPGRPLGGNPDWMSSLPDELLDVPLWSLAIPGSHDSMSFCLDKSSPVLGSEPPLLRVCDRLFPCCTRPCIDRWATTQQSVLSDQCDLGIRYLDLRIAKKPAADDRLFFAHGIYTLITVKEALDELAAWLDAHPREIVIICCSHFELLTDEDHGCLVEYILKLFRDKLCFPKDSLTLRSCQSKGQQVIVSYGKHDVVLKHKELWEEVPYYYANSPDPEKVIAYLEAHKSKGTPDRFFALGLNLTEDLSYVLYHPLQTMRAMTVASLPLLLGWLSEQRPGRGGGVNIMCSDFVGLSRFCSIVIGLNYKLLAAAGPACRAP
ncbi:PI-PLC X domain-containing protein 1-like [Echeneis naucrates]|uniref:PI-PLC X domain-containing protein 1-like n=1 Tax=Echeneis naucrates TaxID=173247 RepID=A0A665SYL4_ECHNA|nr:PI-PLC X domain-containing protein 1-like [Echeneis naucrates]